MSSPILQQAIDELGKLPLEQQDSIAARWLEELKSEQIWVDKFTSTTDEQWDKLADMVRQDIIQNDVTSLDEFLDNSTE